MKIDGKKLNAARERELMSVREFCDACNISTCTWWRACNDGDIRVTTVRRICEALHVKPEEILAKEGGESGR